MVTRTACDAADACRFDRTCFNYHNCPPPEQAEAPPHHYQEFNEHGNTCHYPGCRLTWDEHPQEITTLSDLAQGERVYINHDGSQRREATR